MRAPASTSATASAQARWRSAFLPNYGTPSLVLERGSGCEVIDVEGRAYLDFVSGIAVSSLGHAHPSLTAAVSEQMQRIAHTSNLYVNEPALRLAERLQLMVPEPSKVFFCQDGATAMEAALKLVRRWASSQLSHRDSPKPRMRHRVVAAQDSFHGRTFGALAVTGSPGKRDPFEPFAHDVTFVPFGDADALAAAVDDTVAAIV
ncbi:MAG: aminotransferase class III-fold pyridoxal phosphate-dependent enzyme, partial [Actinobacteria bacterium]|nr:aminotransferase class III-fold pyridoxal phosphate-dependent enzyme [Actinomycetota bacterium]